MGRKKYSARMTFKILFIEFIVSSIGILFGFTYSVYKESYKWTSLVYPGIKIEGLDIGGMSRNEAVAHLKEKFIDAEHNKKTVVQAVNKNFDVNNSSLIDKYDIESAVSQAVNYGKNIGPFQKHRLIKYGVQKQFNLDIQLNERAMREFIKNIESQSNRSPSNAYINVGSEGTITVSKETDGYELKEAQLEEEVLKALHSSSSLSPIKAPVEAIKPKITADRLSEINSNISSFTTNYASSSFERARNIELAASFINGKLLMPGETFSFNEIVGERTEERGFQPAPVVVDHKVESGFGGGICQVSSTLYNAVLLAGMNATERTHHTLPSAYVKLGMDATVDWNDIDFKFKNTLNYPIVIEMNTSNRNLYANIYSNSALLKRRYIVTNNIYQVINSNTNIIDDPNLSVGQNLILQNAYNGYKVKTIRSTYENGVMIGSEIISNDYYTPVNGVKKVGIKE